VGINWIPVLSGLGAAVLIGGIGTTVVFAMRRRRLALKYADEAPELPQKRMRVPNMLSELEDDNENA
jgi:hypothetical protein